jgi:hypothetical protein
LTHGGQTDIVGELDIIITDDGEFFRHAQTEFARRLLYTQCLCVAGGENRRMRILKAQHLNSQPPGLIATVIAVAVQVRIDM